MPEIVNKICELLENGASQKDAARLAGVSEDTFYEWLKSKPEFSESVRLGVATYKHKLITTLNAHIVKDGKIALEILKARWPEEWSGKQKIEITSPQERLKEIFDHIDEKFPNSDENIQYEKNN